MMAASYPGSNPEIIKYKGKRNDEQARLAVLLHCYYCEDGLIFGYSH